MKATALVFRQPADVMVGGMTLADRAILLASRSGLDPVYVWSPHESASSSLDRLRARGAAPVPLPPDRSPFDAIDGDTALVVVAPDALFGPSLLDALGGGGRTPLAASEAGEPLLLFVPPEARAAVSGAGSFEEAAVRLAAAGVPGDGFFVRRVRPDADSGEVEREYIRHLTGRGESFFTKKIRRFSVPLTTRLVRLGARPAHVTIGGLALAVASAWFLARGSYVAGVLGGLLYYASMVFDCSDGEVARVTLRESPSGAWLETFVDYSTYFVILGAVTMASQTRTAADTHRVAAWIALAGTVFVILVLTYMRQRVAGGDPGQFDDASSKVLARSSKFHQFARWGRQWIKRSSIAHLVLFLAIAGQLPVLLYLWAFGATVATVVVLIVEPFVVRRVRVPAAGHAHGK